MKEKVKTQTGGRLLIDCLLRQGATIGYSVPGESYLGVLDALYDVPDQLKLIICRQEGSVAFMAEAHGRLTGKPGLGFVTRGPGAANAVIGVQTAHLDGTPMILFVGQ
ncbi:MAG: thiamine pyrophosphate-binding protein, partial [Emcibacteraceae bacterium]